MSMSMSMAKEWIAGKLLEIPGEEMDEIDKAMLEEAEREDDRTLRRLREVVEQLG